MSLMIIAAICTAFNFLIVLYKFQTKRYLHALVDTACFVSIAFLFAGTISGLQIGMMASMIVSLYLLVRPPKLSI